MDIDVRLTFDETDGFSKVSKVHALNSFTLTTDRCDAAARAFTGLAEWVAGIGFAQIAGETLEF